MDERNGFNPFNFYANTPSIILELHTPHPTLLGLLWNGLRGRVSPERYASHIYDWSKDKWPPPPVIPYNPNDPNQGNEPGLGEIQRPKDWWI